MAKLHIVLDLNDSQKEQLIKEAADNKVSVEEWVSTALKLGTLYHALNPKPTAVVALNTGDSYTWQETMTCACGKLGYCGRETHRPSLYVCSECNDDLRDDFVCESCFHEPEDESAEQQPQMSSDFFTNEKLLAMMALHSTYCVNAHDSNANALSEIEKAIAELLKEAEATIIAIPEKFCHLLPS